MAMTISVQEKPVSQRLSETLSKKSVETQWQAKGIPPPGAINPTGPTREDIEAAVIAQTPQSIGTGTLLFRASMTAEEVDYLNFVWDVTVTYELPDWQAKQTGDSTFAFDTTGGTQHIVHSRRNVATYPNTAPDPNGMIGPTADDVTGCDITIPQFGFTGTLYLDPSLVTTAYIANLYDLTGKVNNAPFNAVIDGVSLTFPEYEVLFLGVQGQKRGQGDFEMTFHFSASPTVTGLSIGSITGIKKRGWDFLSVITVRKAVGTADLARVSMTPQCVYVDEVYDSGDFSLLRLPTTKFVRLGGF